MIYVRVSGLPTFALITLLKVHAWTPHATCRNMSGPMHLPCSVIAVLTHHTHTPPPCHDALTYRSQRPDFNYKDEHIKEIGLRVQKRITVLASM